MIADAPKQKRKALPKKSNQFFTLATKSLALDLLH